MSENVAHFVSHKIKHLAEHSLTQVDEACRDGHGWRLWIAHVDQMAEVMASSTYLAHLANRGETVAPSLPAEAAAQVLRIGRDFADVTLDSFAATFDAAGPDLLAQIWSDAASRFQSHLDRLLAGAGGLS